MMVWPSEEDILANIVAQTAEFRYCASWAGARRLLVDRGIDPMRCLRLSVDQGCDVNMTLVLPTGEFVSVDMGHDSETWEFVSINEWEEFSQDDREGVLARTIVLNPDIYSFDWRVREVSTTHRRRCDASVPPTD